MATLTRERIYAMLHEGGSVHYIAAVLGVTPEDVVATLLDPAHEIGEEEEGSPEAPSFTQKWLNSGLYYTTDGPETSVNPSLDRVYYNPIWIPEGLVLQSAHIVAFAVASSFTRVGLASSENGFPKDLLVDWGQVNCAGAGVKDIATDLDLSAYFPLVFGVTVGQGVAPSLRGINNTTPFWPGGKASVPQGTNHSFFREPVLNSGVLATPSAPIVLQEETAVPRVTLRAA